MILHSKKILSLLKSVLCALLLFPGLALAQSTVSFTVSPTIFDMTANPGQVWKSSIRVINPNPYDLKVYMNVVNFRPQGETGVPTFLPVSPESEPPIDFARWITTTPEVVIPAETTFEVPLQIALPADAEPGGHFAAVLIGTKPPENSNSDTKVETSQIISSLLFLRVSGDIIEEASIRSFNSLSYFISKPETTFELRIENNGNVHVQPQGEIKIFNMWGQERGIIPVNKQNLFGNVLSDSVRKYNFDWKGEWSVADIGRYTAEVTLSYGVTAKQSLAAKTSFWIIPWKILLLTIVSLVAFVYLFSWGIRTYIRRMLVMAGVPSDGFPRSTSTYVKQNVSMTAPLGAGMLDLRKRLEKTDSVKAFIGTVLSFVRQYWKFFAVAAAALLFIWLLIGYFQSALTPARPYEVTTDAGATFTSEEIEASEEVISVEPMALGTPVIKVVDRSGSPALIDKVVAIITAAGYEVTETAVEEGSAEERTVIVFSISETDIALALSASLNNAPLSAISSNTENLTPEVTIYIGSDAENL